MQDRSIVETYKSKLEDFKTATSAQPQTVWDRLNKVLSSLTPEQTAYMESSEDIMMKKQKLLEHFNAWLFEKYKTDFVSIPAFSKEAEDYVSSLEASVSEFAEHNKKILQDYHIKLKENEELKAELKRLKEIQL